MLKSGIILAQSYPFELFGFLLLGHLVANAVRVPESPHRQLLEDTDLGENIEFQKFVRFLIVSEGIGFVGRLRIVLAAGVLVEISEPSTVKSVRLSDIPSKAQRCTYVRPRCEEIHFRRHNPISNSFSEGSGLRHSASRSWNQRRQVVSAGSH